MASNTKKLATRPASVLAGLLKASTAEPHAAHASERRKIAKACCTGKSSSKGNVGVETRFSSF